MPSIIVQFSVSWRLMASQTSRSTRNPFSSSEIPLGKPQSYFYLGVFSREPRQAQQCSSLLLILVTRWLGPAGAAATFLPWILPLVPASLPVLMIPTFTLMALNRYQPWAHLLLAWGHLCDGWEPGTFCQNAKSYISTINFSTGQAVATDSITLDGVPWKSLPLERAYGRQFCRRRETRICCFATILWPLL